MSDTLYRYQSVSANTYLLRSGLFLLLLVFIGVGVWHVANEQQLQTLKQKAQSDLSLYQRKIQRELEQVQPELLPLIANHPLLKKFLLSNTVISYQNAQQYLTQVSEFTFSQ